MVTSVSHSLTWPWVFLGLAVVVAVITTIVALRARKHRSEAVTPDDALWVANSKRLQSLPAFRSWMKRYRMWQWAGAACLVVALVLAAAVTARPQMVQVKQSVLGSRDIVLCLDISASMLEYDQEMVEVFQTLVKEFDGERIALSVFNETSRTVFPLTDDYSLVAEQLEDAYQALDPAVLYTNDDSLINRYLYFSAGTLRAKNEASSLIGDGLASCSFLFDGTEDDGRSRSIILATDNDLRGRPVYTLQQALELTKSKDIEVSALYGASTWVTDPTLETAYRDAVTTQGGYFYHAADAEAVADIVTRVQAQQAVDLDAAPEVTRTDTPRTWFIWLLVAVAGLIVVQWRVKE